MDETSGQKTMLCKVSWIWSIATMVFLLLSAYVYYHGIMGLPYFLWCEKTIPKQTITYKEGNLYLAELGDDRLSSHLRPSPARLLEDDNKLGPANAVRSEIKSKGKGRYTFLGNGLYFSSSDKSSPISNDKEYKIRYPFILWEEVVYGITIFFVLGIIIAGVITVGPDECIGERDA